jgi:uncharacterized membrane protein YbhN (UPF0104 family)
MIFVLLDYKGGVDSFIGTTVFQPIIGGLISIVTIGICLLIGLPIRFSDKIHTWWTKRIWLSILGTVIGLFLLILSLLPSMTERINATIENEIIQRQIPNLGFATTGWLLTCFSLLHQFPPNRFRVWTEEMIRKYTGGRSENTRQHHNINHRRVHLL